MTPLEFFNKCKNFDWFYGYSDDYSVYARGEREGTLIVSIAKSDEFLGKIHEAWKNHIYSGPLWKNEAKPAPKLEDFGL